MKGSTFNLCKFGMIHVIKHDMDPNSNINYRRKIGPVIGLTGSFNPGIKNIWD